MAEKSADKLSEMAYPSGHLVHMPSHIYIRVGRYQDATIANEKAFNKQSHLLVNQTLQKILIIQTQEKYYQS